MRLDLIDEFRLDLHPTSRASGTPLFYDVASSYPLDLVSTSEFRNGTVGLYYLRHRNQRPTHKTSGNQASAIEAAKPAQPRFAPSGSHCVWPGAPASGATSGLSRALLLARRFGHLAGAAGAVTAFCFESTLVRSGSLRAECSAGDKAGVSRAELPPLLVVVTAARMSRCAMLPTAASS